VNLDLVEQPGIVELTHEVAAAHDPDVAPARGRHQFVVHRPDRAGDEPDVHARDRRQVPVGEDPARAVVVELPPALRPVRISG
jgi:hypothetical protein